MNRRTKARLGGIAFLVATAFGANHIQDAPQSRLDYDKNGKIEARDGLQYAIDVLLGSAPDYNGDGVTNAVDSTDFFADSQPYLPQIKLTTDVAPVYQPLH